MSFPIVSSVPNPPPPAPLAPQRTNLPRPARNDEMPLSVGIAFEAHKINAAVRQRAIVNAVRNGN